VQYSAAVPVPRPVSLSLEQTHDKKIYHQLNARPFEVIDNAPVKVGVVGLIGPNLEKKFPKEQYIPNVGAALPASLQQMGAAKVEFAVILHHEYPDAANGTVQMDKDRRAMAERCAKFCEKARQANPGMPPVGLIMTLTEEPEPPGTLQPIAGTPTHHVEIGHKGKYVGVVGVFRKQGGFELKYEIVCMDPIWQPKAGATNPIEGYLEDYAKRVKKDDLLAKVVRSPHQTQLNPLVIKKYGGARFVGSDVCASCHTEEAGGWAKTRHAHALDTLVKATRPSLRQFDPECVVCHTVGLHNPGGYNDLPASVLDDLKQKGATPAAVAKRLAKHNANLANVGCESCHGPGSAHANNPSDADLYPVINPYRPTKLERDAAAEVAKAPNAAKRKEAEQRGQRLFKIRMGRLDQNFCQKCHDSENDVHWSEMPFLEKWVGGGIVHNRKDNVGNPSIRAYEAERKNAVTETETKKLPTRP
jgi:hypothetical protein